jgi:hypothetical protein
VEAAGIAPASQIVQAVSPHSSCVEHGCQWLHYVCNDGALEELVANWHLLTPAAMEKIMDLARGKS